MSILFISTKRDKPVQNLPEVCSRLLLSTFYKLECAILSFIVTIYHDILDKHIARQENVCSTYPIVVVHFDSFKRNEQFASITPDIHRELSCGLLQLLLILSCGWPDSWGWIRVVPDSILRPNQVTAAGYNLRLSRVPADGFNLRLSRVPAVGYKLRLNPMADSSSGGLIRVEAVSSYGEWIQVTTDSILRLTLVPSAEYELRLILSYGQLEFQQLDTSCSWLRPTADVSSGGWIRVTADFILRLTRVPAARYDLQLIHPAAD